MEICLSKYKHNQKKYCLQMRKIHAALTENILSVFILNFFERVGDKVGSWTPTTSPRLKIASANPWLLTGRKPCEGMKTVRAITSEEQHKSTDTRSSNQGQEAKLREMQLRCVGVPQSSVGSRSVNGQNVCFSCEINKMY